MPGKWCFSMDCSLFLGECKRVQYVPVHAVTFFLGTSIDVIDLFQHLGVLLKTCSSTVKAPNCGILSRNIKKYCRNGAFCYRCLIVL